VPQALAAIAQAPAGALVLLHCQGSADAFAAQCQTWQHDEPPAPEAASKMNLRTYGIGAQILRDLSVGRMKLLSRPRKMPSMAGFNLEVTGYQATPEIAYPLHPTKRSRA